MTDPTDEDLVRRFGGGDGRAFDDLLRRYERKVYAVAYRMCSDPDDARDVTQEVFLSAYTALKTYRFEAQLGTWFHRVAVNASLDRLRRRKRRAESPLELVGDAADSGPAPEEKAEQAERSVVVQRALAALSPDHRAVLVLHDLQDLDYAAVAEALNVPLGTVKSRIHRARAELAVLLGHLRPAHGDQEGPEEQNQDPESLRER